MSTSIASSQCRGVAPCPACDSAGCTFYRVACIATRVPPVPCDGRTVEGRSNPLFGMTVRVNQFVPQNEIWIGQPISEQEWQEGLEKVARKFAVMRDPARPRGDEPKEEG